MMAESPVTNLRHVSPIYPASLLLCAVAMESVERKEMRAAIVSMCPCLENMKTAQKTERKRPFA